MTDSTIVTGNSLIKPDFSDLWSVAWIGGAHNPNKIEDSFINTILSTMVITMIPMAWVIGFLSPFIILILIYFKYYTSAICILSVILYPYIFSSKIKPSTSICRFYIKYGCNYFEGGCSMIYESPPNDLTLKLQSRKPSMVCYAPHGIFTLGLFYNSGVRLRGASDQSIETRQKYCGSIYGTDNIAFNAKCLEDTQIPFVGLADNKLCNSPLFNHVAVKWTGCIDSCSSSNVKYLMKQNKSFGMMPGGFFEISLFEYGKEFIYIKNKKGFIKYALQFGYQIVPAYSFGESKSYKNLLSVLSKKYKIVNKVVKWLSAHNLPALFFIGPYPWINPFIPYKKNVGIHTIHGKPIKTPKIANPTKDDINKHHKLYCKEVQSLFNRNKFRFGMDNIELIML